MSISIGIDLGCEGSCIAFIRDGVPRMISQPSGSFIVPSAVYFNPDAEVLVGEQAITLGATSPERVLRGAPRLLGCRFESFADKTPQRGTDFAFVEAPNGDVLIRLGEKTTSSVELCGRLLCRLKQAAEEQTGESVEEAIISIPTSFNAFQRRAVKDAAARAGLEAERLISHSTAAGLAYGFTHPPAGCIAVTDFGAGTLDISLLELQDGIFQTLSTSGDSWLGGEDISDAIVQWLVEETGLNNTATTPNGRALRELAETTKIELSSPERTEVRIQIDANHRERVLTRSAFERLIDPMLRSARQQCRQALADSGSDPEEIEEVLLIGGSSHIPRFTKLVREVFGRKPAEYTTSKSWAAMGAAIHCAILNGEIENLVLLDVISHTLGVELRDGSFIPVILRNSTLPTRKGRLVSAGQFEKGEIRLLEGESVYAKDNLWIASHQLEESLLERSDQLLEVAVEIDVNGNPSLSVRPV